MITGIANARTLRTSRPQPVRPFDDTITNTSDRTTKPASDAPEDAGDIPEEGLNAERDVGADGEVPMVGEQELEVDRGDYGDRRARTADGEEAHDGATYEEE